MFLILEILEIKFIYYFDIVYNMFIKDIFYFWVRVYYLLYYLLGEVIKLVGFIGYRVN